MVEFNQHTKRLSEFDQKLAELERAANTVREERREYINRHGLNKPHDNYTRG